MNCGNCGTANDYDATVCSKCGSTLALTEYYRPTGFVEKKNTPKEPKKEPWDQDILTEGYKKKPRTPVEAPKTSASRKTGTTSSGGKSSSASGQKSSGRTPSKSAGGKKAVPSGQRATTSKTKAAPKKITDNKVRKEISNSRVYNHTTKKLSLAEKSVMKTGKKKKSRKWIFPLILVVLLLFAAAAIFVGTMNAGSREDRFKQVAEEFVCAVVTNDEARAADCIHPKMYESVRPMNYDNVQRCEANAYTTEQVEAETLSRELSENFGISDPITELYRIRVGYTFYGEQSYGVTKTMDVFVARIGDGIYAVKTENID